MNSTTVKNAETEAKRFLQRVHDYNERMKRDCPMSGYIGNTIEGGALKRASLDLTRALAALRRP